MIRRARGTTDRLPEASLSWDLVVKTFTRECELRGFKPITTPTIEHTDLFSRTTGRLTDIVQKEMYTFNDRGGDSLTLRPEGTAPVVRAYIQNGMRNLPQPVKLYYICPIFRYDRPQAGRYREHHQIGAEALGDESASVDAEIIDLLWSTYRALGITDLQLNINSLGDPETRPAYRKALLDYFKPHEADLDAESRQRLEINPFRVLDSKNPAVVALFEDAPRSTDFLSPSAQLHFEDLQSLLATINIPVTVNNQLVRGLDYYNRTVFEFIPPDVGAQSTVGGGGRYDYLSELIGGDHTPGVGFGSGIERVLLNMERTGHQSAKPRSTAIYIAPLIQSALSDALHLASELRELGISAEFGFKPSSPRAQLRRANAISADLAVLIGENEMKQHVVSVKPLDGAEQIEIARSVAAQQIRDLIEPSP